MVMIPKFKSWNFYASGILKLLFLSF
jgi:hypothetical protein